MDKRQDLVTIVVPAYNAETFLCENIESILNQTYRKLEIIYVCDGCTDHTAEMLQEYSAKDSRITVVIEKENHGAAASRNIGMNMASGDWIIFWDADDLFHDHAIESMLETARMEQADIVGSYWEDFDDAPSGQASVANGIRKLLCGTYPVIDTKGELNHIFQLMDNSPCTKLVHKSIYKREDVFFQDLPNSNDVYYAMTAVMNSHKVAYVDQAFLYYRSGKGRVTISTDRNSKQAHILEACDKVYEYIHKHGNNQLLLRSFYNAVLENVRSYSDYDTYEAVCSLLRDIYLRKWGMKDKAIERELSFINRVYYKNILNGSTSVDWQSISMQAELEFIRVLSHYGCSIWGAGLKGKNLLQHISDDGIEIQHVFDSAPDKWGQEIQGYIIENFDKADADNIVVTTPRFYSEISDQLKGRVKNIYNLEQQIWYIPYQYELWNEMY